MKNSIKIITLILITFFFCHTASSQDKLELLGKIGKYEIEVSLVQDEQYFSGEYKYKGRKNALNLRGWLYDNQLIYLEEYNLSKITGKFYLEILNGKLKGKWLGKRNYFVELELVSGQLYGTDDIQKSQNNDSESYYRPYVFGGDLHTNLLEKPYVRYLDENKLSENRPVNNKEQLLHFNNLLLGEDCVLEVFGEGYPILKLDLEKSIEHNRPIILKSCRSVVGNESELPKIDLTSEELSFQYSKWNTALYTTTMTKLKKENIFRLEYVRSARGEGYHEKIAFYEMEKNKLKRLTVESLKFQDFTKQKLTKEDENLLHNFFHLSTKVHPITKNLETKLWLDREYEDFESDPYSPVIIEEPNAKQIEFLKEFESKSPKYQFENKQWSYCSAQERIEEEEQQRQLSIKENKKYQSDNPNMALPEGEVLYRGEAKGYLLTSSNENYPKAEIWIEDIYESGNFILNKQKENSFYLFMDSRELREAKLYNRNSIGKRVSVRWELRKQYFPSCDCSKNILSISSLSYDK